MDKTIWRAHPRLEGVEVSSNGEIRGHRARNANPHRTGTKAQYWAIKHDGRPYLVHRLVCETWHGEAPPGRGLTLHRNDNKSDNRAENLRWGNARENAYDAMRNGIPIGRPKVAA